MLADPAVQIIVHAGRQDVALVRRRFGTEVRNVFDTQVAAGFAGLGAQSSYDSLLSEVLGLRVAKTASFTRWDARPLSPEQLAYAREDVVHLLELAAELERRLRELGRLQWALEECQPLERSSDERDPEAIFARLPRVGTLNASARPIARELVQWRERTAARRTARSRACWGTPALVEIAKRRPSSRAELEKIRGVGGGAGGQARAGSARRGPARTRTPRRPAAAARARAGAEARRRSARGTRRGAAASASARGGTRLRAAGRARRPAGDRRRRPRRAARRPTCVRCRGWRRELVGAELLELLDGRVSLSVKETDAADGCRSKAWASTPGR